MTRKEQDDEERAFIELMIERLPVAVMAPPVKRERPDFMLSVVGGTTVGVEVAQARDGAVAAGRAAVKRLKRALEGAPNLANLGAMVSVSISERNGAALTQGMVNANVVALSALLPTVVAALDEPPPFDESDVPTTPGALREAVKAQAVRAAEMVFDRRVDEDEDEPWLRTLSSTELEAVGVVHVDAVRVIRAEGFLVTWSSAGYGGQGHLVQDLIDKKTPKLAEYRTLATADQFWLLLVAGAGAGASIDSSDVEGRTFTSPFDRTVFLDLYEGRCFDVPVATERK